MTSRIATDGNAAPVQEMLREDFWREQFPELSIGSGRASSAYDMATFDAQATQHIDARILKDGYFQERDQALSGLAALLDNMVKRCVSMRIPTPFLFLFDEPWVCFYRLHPILQHLLGEDYRILPDFWVWHIDHTKDQAGWPPHRDKGGQSLRQDGMPLSLTVWIPLSEATPLNGCMYMLPACRDPVYNTPQEKQWMINLPAIRALPAVPGDFLCWNQAVLHWGSQSSVFASQPRTSMALEFQRGDIPPYNAPLLTPLAIHDFNFTSRLRLVAKQILQYTHMYKLDPEVQALAQKILSP